LTKRVRAARESDRWRKTAKKLRGRSAVIEKGDKEIYRKNFVPAPLGRDALQRKRGVLRPEDYQPLKGAKASRRGGTALLGRTGLVRQENIRTEGGRGMPLHMGGHPIAGRGQDKNQGRRSSATAHRRGEDLAPNAKKRDESEAQNRMRKADSSSFGFLRKSTVAEREAAEGRKPRARKKKKRDVCRPVFVLWKAPLPRRC